MNSRFYINSVGRALSANDARAVIAAQQEIQETVTLTKTFPRMWPAVECATEFVAGVFAVFYLVAAFALGGALLFFTFYH